MGERSSLFNRFKSMAHRYNDQPNPPAWYGPVFTAVFIVLFGGAFGWRLPTP